MSVSLRELDAVGFQAGAQLAVVFDDAVVHNRDAASHVGVRVGVAVVGRAVGCPPSVPDAGRPVDRAVAELLLEILDPPGLLGDLQRAVAVDDGDTRGVVAAVFEQPQAVEDDLQRVAGSDVADDSAHGNRGYGT